MPEIKVESQLQYSCLHITTAPSPIKTESQFPQPACMLPRTTPFLRTQSLPSNSSSHSCTLACCIPICSGAAFSSTWIRMMSAAQLGLTQSLPKQISLQTYLQQEHQPLTFLRSYRGDRAACYPLISVQYVLPGLGH